MSTVIEHGVVVPKPTVKAVACCTERLKVLLITLVITGYTLGSGFAHATNAVRIIQKFFVCRAHETDVYNSSATLPSACIAHAPTLV